MPPIAMPPPIPPPMETTPLLSGVGEDYHGPTLAERSSSTPQVHLPDQETALPHDGAAAVHLDFKLFGSLLWDSVPSTSCRPMVDIQSS